MKRRLLLLPGDGIGPEVLTATERVMEVARHWLRETTGTELTWETAAVGGRAIDLYDDPLPPETLERARAADAVLLGAVGGPRWEGLPGPKRPEAGLLGLRKELGVYANLRPVRISPHLAGHSPVRFQGGALDCLIVRELTGGLYFGEPRFRDEVLGERRAVDTMVYTEGEIRRVAHLAFQAARRRRGRVTSVDKANVLESSRLWREVVEEVAAGYPDVELAHQLVDSAAMLLVTRPEAYDVLLTENLFGDILSDLAGGIAGSLGVLPSASLGEGGTALYEPVHGSAPDIAGQDLANPLGAILSFGLLCRYSLGNEELARAVEEAVEEVLAEGYRTADLWHEGATRVGTQEMAGFVADRLSSRLVAGPKAEISEEVKEG